MVIPAFTYQLDAVFFETKRDLLEGRDEKVSCNNFPSFYLTVKIGTSIENRKNYPIKCCQLETVSEMPWSVCLKFPQRKSINVSYFLTFCMVFYIYLSLSQN